MVQDDLSNEVYRNDDDPKNYEEAMQSLDLWTLVEASKDIKPIGCKWVYKKRLEQMEKLKLTKPELIVKLFPRWQCSNQFGFYLP
ncbi:hypothetical protein AAG906_037363 [Vitis piasezkii]